MRAEDVVAEVGGLATRAQVLDRTTEHALRRALAEGRVVRLARGRNALPETTQGVAEKSSERRARAAGTARRAAHEMQGVAVLLSAAAAWGWATKWYPTRPQVVVPRGRAVPESVRRRIAVSWRRLPTTDVVDGWVTDRVRTAVDCACDLPEDEALAVLDSALREGVVDRDELLMAVARLHPSHPRRGRAERLVRLADPAAANPFESVLRWIVHDVPGLVMVPSSASRTTLG